MLSTSDAERFARQIILPQIGALGQERLLSSQVELCARGPAADALRLYLVAAGVTVVAAQPESDEEALRVVAVESAAEADRWLLGPLGVAHSAGSPCGRCLAVALRGALPGALAPAIALAAGCLAAAPILLALAGTEPPAPFVSLVWPEARSFSPAVRRGCDCG